MTRHRLYHFHPKIVRDALNDVRDLAAEIHRLESDLITKLKVIDEKRFYVRYGFNSLMGFCNTYLNFSRVQSQRIVTRVRRLGAKPVDSGGIEA
jgi:hypothetical protein